MKQEKAPYIAGKELVTYRRAMTDDEKVECSTKIARLIYDLDSLETEKKEVTNDFATKIKDVRKKMETLSSNINLGEVEVEEECTKYIDGGIVKLYNQYGKLVLERPIKQNERQTSILDESQQSSDMQVINSIV